MTVSQPAHNTTENLIVGPHKPVLALSSVPWALILVAQAVLPKEASTWEWNRENMPKERFFPLEELTGNLYQSKGQGDTDSRALGL